MIPKYAIVLVSLLAASQDKPATPAVPFAQILECVRAANCKNMTPAAMSTWSDAVGFRGLVFDDAGWRYELFITGPARDELSIMLRAPQEPRPSQLLQLNKTGQLVLAELRGDGARSERLTAEQLAARRKDRKAFVSAPRSPDGVVWGEEFRPFWQKQADQALAAIARALTGSPQELEKPPVSFDAIVGCVKAGNCKNMQPGAINWFDVVNISVIGFKDETGAYALNVSRDGALSIWITPPGETRPSRLVSVGPEGTVLTGELGPLPGDVPPTQRMSPEETAQWRVKHKAFLSPKLNRSYGSWGEEFRTFWEDQASIALAAIRRQISK